MGPILGMGNATCAQIKWHLQDCDSLYEPALHSRVNIEQYAEKIYEKAERFEAWDDDRLVGLIAAYLPDGMDGPCFVTNVSILEKYHGGGLALDLMRFFIAKVAELKCESIALEVSRQNVKAIHFYEKMGFSIVNCAADILTMRLALGVVE